MKIVIPGGSGQVGQILARDFVAKGHEAVVLCRGGAADGRVVPWDGRTVGDWAREIDGADVVINLAGRSVNCRYTPENLSQMMSSRVDSTRAVGEAIAQAKKPPSVWLQMSTATIYAHRFDAANGESTGILGGSEPGVPAYWSFSVKIATEWERALAEAKTPSTRKVALRTSMVMSPDPDGILDVMIGMVRKRLGGTAGDGKQFVSWIHDRDFVRAIHFLLEHPELDGAVNVAGPAPLPYAEFMRDLRAACGQKIGLPAAKWMLEIGAWAMRTDTELVLKSRRVVPERLLNAGFRFEFDAWDKASRELLGRWRAARSREAPRPMVIS